MACFLVPMSEAIITTIIQKTIGRERAENLKLNWLNIMLWGGVILLAIEHIWHGEVVPWPPFLTAMQNPADFAAMIHEMAIVGSAMAITITVTWIVLVKVASIIQARYITPVTAKV